MWLFIGGVVVIAVLVWSLACLAISQKESELDPVGYVLRVTLIVDPSLRPYNMQFTWDTLQECQTFLNVITFPHIKRAGVWNGATMTHVMNSKGILEAV